MPHQTLFFDRERAARASAARARDLAASATDLSRQRAFLAEATLHARAVPGSLYERLLIRG